MKATPQHDASFVFTGAFIIIMTILLLLAFPLIQSALESFNNILGNLLGAFSAEILRSYGR
ncbi:MAG: hypothetical protein R2824_07455 [Saprospiraceae bacterium]|nr:hypothetical protein [Lewinella sp.]